MGNYVVTQKGLYVGLFGLGIPLLWFAAYVSLFIYFVRFSGFDPYFFGILTALAYSLLNRPMSTFFWIVGASAFCILFHACLFEPGVESEYSNVQDSV